MIEKVKAGIQLKSITLANSMFSRGGYLETPDIEGKEMNVSIEGKKRDDFIDCGVTVSVGDLEKKGEIAIIVDMVGVFERVGDFLMSDEEFCNVNAAAIIFPYIRQHVRALSLDAGLAPIILPLVNFQKRYELKKAKEQAQKSS